MSEGEGYDPRDRWVDPTQLETVSVFGRIRFSCCGIVSEATGDEITHVSCPKCHAVYGMTLQIALISADEYRFRPGDRVRVRESVPARAGSTPVLLDPTVIYTATQDTHGVLNVPPGWQPILVEAAGERGPRTMVAVVPEGVLEPVGPEDG